MLPRLLRTHGFVLALVLMQIIIVVLALSGAVGREWWQIGQLGLIEGVTEFLPISSTGHLLIASALLDFEHSIGGTFEIFIQLGAVIAVAGYYLPDLLAQARAVRTSAETRRFWLAIIVAFLPAALIGLVLHDWIKAVLFSPSVIGWALVVGGVVFIVVERVPLPVRTHTPQQMTLWQALAIGFAQVLAMIPGTSRSGASIVGGLLAGLDRKTATAFSFYLAIPTLGAATLFDLWQSLDLLTPGDMGRLLLGLVVSLIIAWLSIGWLLRYVATNTFVVFGIYRIIAGIVILVMIAAGRL